ncbi:class F sortase [Actinoplanes sp. Pm04-4]|uniref:Class F sortase n=1 Tax=Paractinoplanes pyxinae TaxID=2997416 RepID=A0ABT4BDP7_9ACTN|nr:class F sortase [Actinoplanes pyxinae]MCY1143728.1 class F sortase [Actinoplanes pyxinae]
MTDGGTSPTTGDRRTRFALLAVTAVLAIIGAALLTTAALRHPSELPRAAGVPTAAPDATTGAPRPGAAAGELTSGPLMATSPPTRISIPALQVTVPVIGLGQQSDGSMQVPTDAKTVGWYTKAPTPGSLGPAVLAGHVDYKKQPGTFAHLADLTSGDTITIAREDGSTAFFTVTATERYAKDHFPSDAVYGPINHAGLRLITCGGDFDTTAGHYRDNIVVYATLSHTDRS